MTVTPGRLVALLTPLVFAPLAGAISVAAATHLPGVELDPDRLEEVFIAGAAIAFGKAGIWLKGWQDHERRHDVPSDAVADDVALEASLAGTGALAGDPGDGTEDIEADERELADGSELDDEELDDLLDEEDDLLAPAARSR